MNKYLPETNTFINYNEKDGLSSSLTESILEDDQGNLWISTNNGISKFNPQNETFSNFNIDDGLQDKEFYFGASFKSADGKMYFGGINGLNFFYPDSIIDNKELPSTQITSFTKLGISPLKLSNVSYLDAIELSYKDKIFSLEFSALDYTAPQKNKYAYKMDGLDDVWIETDYKNRKVTFTGLQAGEYTFMVKSSNSDGYWDEDGATIQVIIHPPWWATTWFRIVAVIILLSLVGLYLRKRTAQLRKRKKELEEEVELRTKESVESRERVDLQNIALDKTSLISQTDAQGQILHVNDLFCNTFKYSREELIGQKHSIVNSGYHKESFWKELWDTINSGKVWRNEVKNLTKDGNYIWSDTVIAPIVKQGNLPSQFISISFDITQRKELEKELHLTQYGMDHAGDSILWIDPPTATILSANEVAWKMLGYSKKELIDMTIAQIDPLFPPENWPPLVDSLKLGNIETFESINKRKDGVTFPIEISARYIEFENQGYIVAFLRDTTERKELDSRLKLIEYGIDSAKDSVCFVDPLTGVILDANINAYKSLGFEKEEIIGRKFWYFDINFLPEKWPAFVEKLKTGEKISYESMNCTADDVLIPIDISASYFEFEGANYIVAFTSDITERKKNEAALNEAKQRMSLALESANMGSWEYLPVTNTLLFDEAKQRLYGMREGDFDGSLEGWLKYIHPEDVDNVVKKVGAAIASGDRYDDDYRVITKENGLRYLSTRGVFLKTNQAR